MRHAKPVWHLVFLVLAGCSASSAVRRPPDAAAPAPDLSGETATAEASAASAPAVGSEGLYQAALASLYLGSGEPAQAAGAAREALGFDPNSTYLRVVLARALMAMGRSSDAWTEVSVALKAQPQDAEVQGAAADILWSMDRPAQAEPFLRRALLADPGNLTRARRLMGRRVAAGDLQDAAALQAGVTAARPDDPEANRTLAEVCVEMSSWTCAEPALAAAVARHPGDLATCTLWATAGGARKPVDAVHRWEVCHRLAPGEPMVAGPLYRAWVRHGQAQGALRVARQQCDASRWDVDTVHQQAQMLLDAPAPTEAQTLLQAAPRAALGPAGVTLLGVAQSMVGQCSQALKTLAGVDTAMASATRVGCLVRLGQNQAAGRAAHAALSQHTQALEVWEPACRAAAAAGKAALPAPAGEPQQWPPAVLLGVARCLAWQGPSAKARQYVAQALAPQPDQPDRLAVQALVLWESGEAQDALGTARALLAVTPQDPTALNLAAYLMVQTGDDPQQAVVLAQQAVDRQPDSAEMLDTLGVAQLAAHQPGAAVATLQRASLWLPYDPEVLLHLGDAQRAAGDASGATVTFGRARRLLPLDPRVGTALKQRLSPLTPGASP